MIKKSFWLVFLAFFYISSAFTQGELDEQTRIFFRNERTFSGSLTSTGWAANFRYSKRINAFSSYLFDVDIAALKHPKEFSSQSPYLIGWGGSYIFGKLNEVYLLRSGLGYQKELFSKVDRGGIAIRYFVNTGLTVGFEKPIYYQKVVGINPITYQVRVEKSPFDPDFMQSIYDIYDKEPFWTGINEVKLNPGAFVRLGLCFEFGPEDNKIQALEGGIQLEGFLKKVPIMASNDNRQLYLSLFATYRFGRVLDARSFE